MKQLIKDQQYKWYAVASFPVVGLVAALVIPPYNHITSVPLPIWRAAAILLTLAGAALVTGLAIKNTKQILGRCALVVLLVLYIAMLFGLLRGFLQNQNVFT
jgi:FtsH-binding integral membrane protein